MKIAGKTCNPVSVRFPTDGQVRSFPTKTVYSRGEPAGLRDGQPTLPAPRASARALAGGEPSREAERSERGRVGWGAEGFGEAEREGASAASGCGGEGAGPEVPEGGSERGGGGGWGAEGRSEPSQGSHNYRSTIRPGKRVRRPRVAFLVSTTRLAFSTSAR